MRFYLDENIPAPTVDYLKRRGHNVRHAALDLGYSPRDDAFHFQEARRERRILLTTDRDFENNRLYPLHLTYGVIIIAVPDQLPYHHLNNVLDKLLIHFRTNASLRQRKVIASTAGYTLITSEETFRHDY